MGTGKGLTCFDVIIEFIHFTSKNQSRCSAARRLNCYGTFKKKRAKNASENIKVQNGKTCEENMQCYAVLNSSLGTGKDHLYTETILLFYWFSAKPL